MFCLWIAIVTLSVSYMCRWNKNVQSCFVFMVHMLHLYFSLFDSLFPDAQRWDLKQKTFWIFFIGPICSPKCILDSPLPIYKVIPKGWAMSVFGTFFTWGFFYLKEKNKKEKTSEKYCNLETELCKRQVKSSLFPVTLSLMKVAKSPGGLKSTVCLSLREHSRGAEG